ncbi:YtpR family tRNA-binding protein [Companilactobacillus sp. DQM5]|uniref:YtpR family tRNA-binding protein n=1 Tax=Companilactobacillus sp. DQM5 TaxID=3463359 RepID=UPI0040587F9D
MLLSFFNPKTLGDILLIIVNEDSKEQAFETKGDVTRIFDKKTQKLIGLNIKNVKDKLNLMSSGQVKLDESQVSIVNNIISDNGFSDILTIDKKTKFVVGHVDEISEHPDSDHLHITKINVGESEDLQIVCGAPNIDKGQNVVVALTGAVMPTGKIIWPGELRGVESYGMVCSASELDLPNAPKERGILVLDEKEVPGTAFNFNI